MSESKIFKFKEFDIAQDQCAMKVGTDGVLLGAWAKVVGAREILDIGTGTGIIALMLAQRAENANVDAVEIDAKSFEQAKDNFMNSKWSKSLHILHITIQDYSTQRKKSYDSIVCNPPFFSGGTLSSNQDKNTVRHTIKLSHQDLLKSARSLLSDTGTLSLILPLLEGLRFIEIAESYGLHCTRKTTIMSKKNKPVERILLEFKKNKSEMNTSTLIIQKEKRNDWTDQYIALTKDFHIGL